MYTYKQVRLASMYGTVAGLNFNQRQSLIATGQKMRAERTEKIAAWKKKSWLEFCKEVMKADKRFSIQPYSDYYNAPPDAKSNGIFAQMVLVRTGVLADVYILPPDPNLGFIVDAGSKYTKIDFHGFPSKAMIYPLIKIADELERQFTREVSIEASKHSTKLGASKGGSNGHTTTRTTGDNDSDQLPTSSEAD